MRITLMVDTEVETLSIEALIGIYQQVSLIANVLSGEIIDRSKAFGCVFSQEEVDSGVQVPSTLD